MKKWVLTEYAPFSNTYLNVKQHYKCLKNYVSLFKVHFGL